MSLEHRNRPGEGAVPRSGCRANSIGDACDTAADQLSIDDALEDGRRRDAGQQAATYSTDVSWIVATDRVIAELAATFEPFTADEGEQLALGQEPPATPGPEGLDEGRRRRDDGMRDARAATWSPWRTKFEFALDELARSGQDFVSDDVLAICGPPLASSANAVGSLMNAAARDGRIERVGYQQSRRPSRHGAVVAIWRRATP